MFPLSVINYVKLAGIVVLLFGTFAFGWNVRNSDFKAYKAEINNVQKEQEAHVESVKKQQEITTKGIQDEYDAKLSLIRQYYSNGVRQPNGSKPMSSISTTTAIADVSTAYNQLIESCAETTQQLVSLQKWLNEQIGIQ